MRYMLLICADENEEAEMTPAAMGEMMENYMKFSQEIEAAGVYEGSDRLKPTASATTVRVRQGKTVTTDGPFAETKEAFGGYYKINVKNLDEAIAWAAKVPSAAFGTVEIRPIWEPEDY